MPELGFRCQLECVDPPTPASQDTPALSCRTRPRCRAASLVTAGSTASFPAPHGLCRPPTALCLCPPRASQAPAPLGPSPKAAPASRSGRPFSPHQFPRSAPERVGFQFSSRKTMGSQKLGPGGQAGGGLGLQGPGPLPPRRVVRPCPSSNTPGVASVKLQVLPFCFCCSESFHRFLLGP